MPPGPSPLLGYNTNVRHAGALYHIQTEDSGIQRPHIITHLFADGGRIVASMKQSYAALLGEADLHDRVKALMQEQHKAMFVALRDGAYDDEEGQVLTQPGESTEGAAVVGGQANGRPGGIDAIALELAAARLASQSAARRFLTAQSATHARAPVPSSLRPKSVRSVFAGDVLTQRSLDEVILRYLAEDLDAAE